MCCQKTNLGFVDSVWEIFGPLLAGVPSVIVPQEALLDPEELIGYLARHGVTRMVLVPSLLRALLDHAPIWAKRLAEVEVVVVERGSAAVGVWPAGFRRRFRKRRC